MRLIGESCRGGDIDDACAHVGNLFHATFAHRLASIMEHGLGAVVQCRNYDVSRSGVVCLSDSPEAAELYAANAQFCNRLDEIIVLMVDARQISAVDLSIDPNDEGEYGGVSYEYRGVIPSSAITVHHDGFFCEFGTDCRC